MKSRVLSAASSASALSSSIPYDQHTEGYHQAHLHEEQLPSVPRQLLDAPTTLNSLMLVWPSTNFSSLAKSVSPVPSGPLFISPLLVVSLLSSMMPVFQGSFYLHFVYGARSYSPTLPISVPWLYSNNKRCNNEALSCFTDV